jgi:uncharacterized protein YoxC
VTLVLDIGVGLGALLIGVGVLVVCSALARLLGRLNATLDEVNRQIAAVSAPVVDMLGHVAGITESANKAVARFGAVVSQLEVGVASVTGITDRLRKLVTAQRATSNGETPGS